MAKKLSIKFTTSSSMTHHSSSSTPTDHLINSFDDLIGEDSSVQLISITDEDSEDNSESFSEYDIQQQPKGNNNNNKVCSVAQDEIDIIDAKINSQKPDKKKSSGVNKVDKFMKHLQEALTSSSSNVDSSKNRENELEDSTISLNQIITTPTPPQTGGKISNLSSGSINPSWLNDIKLGNFVNLNKLRNEKQQKASTEPVETCCDSGVMRKLSSTSGIKNYPSLTTTITESNKNQIMKSSENNLNETGDHNYLQQQNNNGKQTSVISFPNLLTGTSNEYEHLMAATVNAPNDIENNFQLNKENKQKLKDIFTGLKSDKTGEPSSATTTKKKFTLFDKKTFQPSKKQEQDLTNKLISPTRTTTSSPAPPSSSITLALLSPTSNNNTLSTNSTSNSQVFSNFLSTFTNSTKQTTNNNNISSFKSASTENVNINGDTIGGGNGISSTSAINKNKVNKIPTSKSMMTFRKVIKCEDNNNTNTNINGEDLGMNILSFLLNSNTATQNPTLRRRAKSSNSPTRTGSPTPDKSNTIKDYDQKCLLSESHSSSSSSTSINYHKQTREFPDEHHHQQQDAKITNENNKSINNIYQQQQSRSLWNSMTSSISFQYYIFLFMAFSSAFFLCISPLPSFLNGFIFGFLMTFFIVTIGIVYLVANFFLIESYDKRQHRGSTTMECVGLKRNKLKRLADNVPSLSNANNDAHIYAGWVYEFIGDYVEREKNGFVSRLVYLVLSGSKLNIFVPSQEMSEKKLKQLSMDSNNRSMSNFFLSSRVVDFSRLHHKRVALYLTKNVRNQRKYIWSKKYPICIEFNDERNEMNREENFETTLQTPSSMFVISKLVIFARTCREKEEWFWALKTSIDSTISYKNSISARGSNNSLTDSPSDSKTNLFVNGGEELKSTDGDNLTTQQQQYLHISTRRLNYNNFMRTNILNAEGIGPGNPGMMTALTWFNVLLNRLSFDILNKPNWSAYIAKKLQRKLRRLRLPYFMESLTITEIDIGSTLPKFNSVPSVPNVDDAGLWIEFDVNYSGGFTMTLETKINLLKFANVESFTEVSPASTPNESPKLTQKIGGRYWCGYRAKYRGTLGSQSPAPGTEINDEFCDNDSDIDSIITSSEDEEPETAPAAPDDADADEKQKKLIRFVEKIASSQYFQRASQMNFFKKALEGVSNMSIMLTVQINSLNGTLAINIPEPPTDRLWYGFRNDPTIQITARPKLGDHDLNLSYVTNFIEKKLRTEFFNYFVIPNMDDFFIPALNTSIEQYINVVP